MEYEITTLQRAMERAMVLGRLKTGYIRQFGETFGPIVFYIEQFGVDCRQVWVAALCREMNILENQPEHQELLQKVLSRSLRVLRKNEFTTLNRSASGPVILDQD